RVTALGLFAGSCMASSGYVSCDAGTTWTDARSITAQQRKSMSARPPCFCLGFDTPAARVQSEEVAIEERMPMAKLALIYEMRRLPLDDLGEVKEATVLLKNGKSARITMHLIEGSKEEIEATFHQSIEAFFEMYPEI